MKQLTGYQRFALTGVWLKEGKPLEREKFIRKVCREQGIKYRPPQT